MDDMDALESHATPRQQEYIRAMRECGSARSAADKLGVHHSVISRSLRSLRQRLERGWAKEEGFLDMSPQRSCVHYVYDEDGNPQLRQSWDRYAKDREALAEAFLAMTGDISPIKDIKAPKAGDKDLLNFLTITDAHIGMLAWHEETRGADWDVDIAKATLLRELGGLLKDSPKTDTCLLNFQGDFLHYDSLEALTPTGKNLLDADGRAPKMVRAGIEVMLSIVQYAAQLHRKVHVWILEGNHDLSFSLLNREWMRQLFSKNDRIMVEQSSNPYYAMPWGKALIGATHGHIKRGASLSEIFSQSFREYMGSTVKTFIHHGHYHSTKQTETNTSVVEQHPTLAAADSYAARHGYSSLRRASCIQYHQDRLEVGRITRTVMDV